VHPFLVSSFHYSSSSLNENSHFPIHVWCPTKPWWIPRFDCEIPRYWGMRFLYPPIGISLGFLYPLYVWIPMITMGWITIYHYKYIILYIIINNNNNNNMYIYIHIIIYIYIYHKLYKMYIYIYCVYIYILHTLTPLITYIDIWHIISIFS
jgi:hypothetical protein